MSEETSTLSKLYHIVSIQKTDSPPGGADGSDWHRYEIAHGTNTISGYKQGKLDDVTRAVEENIEQLNERQFGKRARTEQSAAKKQASS